MHSMHDSMSFTTFVSGCAIYTGQDTKISLNSKYKSSKYSRIEKWALFIQAFSLLNNINWNTYLINLSKSSRLNTLNHIMQFNTICGNLMYILAVQYTNSIRNPSKGLTLVQVFWRFDPQPITGTPPAYAWSALQIENTMWHFYCATYTYSDQWRIT